MSELDKPLPSDNDTKQPINAIPEVPQTLPEMPAKKWTDPNTMEGGSTLLVNPTDGDIVTTIPTDPKEVAEALRKAAEKTTDIQDMTKTAEFRAAKLGTQISNASDNKNK